MDLAVPCATDLWRLLALQYSRARSSLHRGRDESCDKLHKYMEAGNKKYSIENKKYNGDKKLNIDVPVKPMSQLMAAAAVCYKPRPGERAVEFKEVGSTPVETWPRFDLDFSELLSEKESRNA